MEEKYPKGPICALTGLLWIRGFQLLRLESFSEPFYGHRFSIERSTLLKNIRQVFGDRKRFKCLLLTEDTHIPFTERKINSGLRMDLMDRSPQQAFYW